MVKKRAAFRGWAIALGLAVVVPATITGGPLGDGRAVAGSRVSDACAPRWRTVVAARAARFSDVLALAPRDVWAVGEQPAGSVSSTPVVARWNGRTLRWFDLPSPNEGRLWQLAAVAGVAPNDIWAVGPAGFVDWGPPAAFHWNGRRWRRVQLPPLGDLDDYATLSDVVAFRRDDVWAVGTAEVESDVYRPLLLRWNGSRWRSVNLGRAAPTDATLAAIAGTSSRDVWAIGSARSGTSDEWRDLVLRWDGRAWRRFDAPLPRRGGHYRSAIAVSGRNVWTLHTFFGEQRVIHWRNRRPSSVFTYPRGGWAGGLEKLVAVSPTGALAVGSYNEGDEGPPVVVSWNGRSWRVARPALGASAAGLTGASALSPTDVWAVGWDYLARYSC